MEGSGGPSHTREAHARGTATGYQVDAAPDESEHRFWWEAYGPRGLAVGGADDYDTAVAQARAAIGDLE